MLSSRKITQRNGGLLPSGLTMKSTLWNIPKGRIVLPVNQAILAEPSILRLLGYIMNVNQHQP